MNKEYQFLTLFALTTEASFRALRLLSERSGDFDAPLLAVDGTNMVVISGPDIRRKSLAAFRRARSRASSRASLRLSLRSSSCAS